MLVNQDKAIKPDVVKVIRYVEGLPCKIEYCPLQPDGQPVETNIVLDDAIILGPTYHGTGIRVKTKEGDIVAISREYLVKITQPTIAGGLRKSVYFGKPAPVQNFGRAGDVYMDGEGKVYEKQEKWVNIMEEDTAATPGTTGKTPGASGDAGTP